MTINDSKFDENLVRNQSQMRNTFNTVRVQ